MKAVEVMAEFMDVENAAYHDDDEDEEDSRAVDTVGSFVSWDASGGTARGKVEKVVREGALNVPDSEFTINAEEGDPAVLIQVYRELRDGYLPTDTMVGHKASELRAIDDLQAPTEEQARKISLRLAKALINNTK